jgi:hypothetical protein
LRSLTPDEESEPGLPEAEPDPKKAQRRFYLAIASYAALALLAWLTMDGKFLLLVWIFLGGLAIKTYLATLQKP